MGLRLITAPAELPVTLAEAKDHMRVDIALDDALIAANIRAAVDLAESFTARALITQTWELLLDAFPAAIELPKPALQSITSITYLDDAGVAQVLAASEYTVDTASPRGSVVPAFGKTWPSTQGVPNAVTVRFVAGYGARNDVPPAIRQAILTIAAEFYERRETSIVGATIAAVPQAGERLLWPYRSLTF